jgi:hypothetical protein
MVRLEFTIEIARTAEDVYALIGDLANDAKWQRAVLEVVKLTPGPIQAGSRYRHTLGILGKRVNVDVEIVERQPHFAYVLQCRSPPFDFETHVRLTPLPSRQGVRSTLVETVVEGRPTGVARIAAVALSRHRSAEIARDLHALKRLMESGAL